MFKKFLIILLIFIGLFGVDGCNNTQNKSDKEIDNAYIVNEKAELLELHNSEREKKKKSPLIINSELGDAAQNHADWMAENKRMSHRGTKGSEPWNRASECGYNYISIGENIAYGQENAQEVMNAWMHSRGHRGNILGNYEEVGFGIAESENGQKYWCVVFGRR